MLKLVLKATALASLAFLAPQAASADCACCCPAATAPAASDSPAPAANAPTAQAQNDRQSYRRYSVSPSSGSERTMNRRAERSPASSRSPWRADRKVLGL